MILHQILNVFINTKENPADWLSRGLEPKELENNPMWFYSYFINQKP